MSAAVARGSPQIPPQALPAGQSGANILELPMQGLALSRDAPVLPESLSSDAQEVSEDAEPRRLPALLRLPGEIRNIIYELALATKTYWTILLIDACPPSQSLLLTCLQLYSEIRHIYKTAYRQYWRTNHFCVNLVSYSTLDLSKVELLDTDDIRRIERLTIWARKEYWPAGRIAYATIQFFHLSGIWSRLVQHEYVNQYWAPTFHSNWIAVRRGGFGTRASNWCLQCDSAEECSDVLRDEEEPMSLKEQVLLIMRELHRESRARRW